MRLFRSELLRLLSRRLVRVVAFGAALAILLGAWTVFFRSHKASDVELRAEAERLHNEVMAECLEHPERFGGFFEPGVGPDGPTKVPTQNLSPEQIRQLCEQVAPPVDALTQDPRYHLAGAQETTRGVSPFVIFLSILIGASFIGAEWHPRTMTTMLTWEPRRVRLWLTKALTVAVVTSAFAILAHTLLVGLLVPSGVWRGTTAGVDGAWVAALIRSILRISVIAGLASVFAMAIATLGRTTVAALGIGFVYFAIIEQMLAALRPGWRPWLLLQNAVQFIVWEKMILYPRNVEQMFGPGIDGGISGVIARTPMASLWIVIGYVAALSLIAAYALRRQDVG